MYKIGRNATRKLAEVTDLYEKLDDAKKSGSLTQAVPLEQHVSYMANIEENVKDLVAKMAELDNLSSDIISEVEEAEKWDQTRRRTQLVGAWLDRVPTIANEVSDITTRYQQLGSCSGDIITMHKRNTTRKLAEVEDLYQKLEEAKKSGSLTQAVPSPPGQEMPGTSKLVATESYLDKVLGYLADGVGVVGIFGMGGVGKTTLLESINNNILSCGGNANTKPGAADDEKRMHFDHVIWVTVSRDGGDVQRLQDIAAKQLKLTLPNEDRSSWGSMIFNFLNNKKFVLLLDDVWERLDLKAIGIPNNQGRAVVFTTRDESVCGEMEARKVVKVEVLKPDDAWRLFQEKAGIEDIDSDTEIKRLARQIAGECKGLPLALVTVGRAMSNKKTSGEWRHALKSLKKSDANAEMILSPLKFSYDNLIDDKTRDCFLCCALFPEDHVIFKGELIECLLGHGVIDAQDFRDIGEIYDYGDTLIGDLKSACLLESTKPNAQLIRNDEEEEEGVKMHDIIRDMALWVANDCKMDNSKWIVRAGLGSQKPLRKTDNWELANRISLVFNKMKALPEPNQSCPNLSTLIIQGNHSLKRISDIFFQHFPALTYLDMSRTGIQIFPEEVTKLVQLQYLNLSETYIESLSSNLKNLENLRYLILHGCYRLRDIPEKSISSLPNLQVLGLFGSGITFDLSIHHNKEVKELRRLRGRRIKALGLDVKLREFSSLDGCVDRTIIWKLRVHGRPSDSPSRDTFMMGKIIQSLWLREFGSLQEFIMMSDDRHGHFPRLRELRLFELSRLKKITWKRQPTLETFPKLTTIIINSCRFTDISWIQYVTRLKYLDISSCGKLSDIITSDSRPPVTFSNLKTIHLDKLPRLRNVYEGTIYCPLLTTLRVCRCEGLTRLPFNFQSHITNNGPLLSIYAKPVKWWESLKWEDDNIKSQLQPFVR